MKYTDEELVSGIFKGSPEIIKTIYDDLFPVINSFVMSNSGSSQDAEDVFQEAQIILYRKIKSGSLVLNCTFKTFLFAVCKKLWLLRLKKKARIPMDYFEQELPDLDNETVESIEKNERYLLYKKHFNRLPESCKKLLLLFFEGNKMKDIAIKMGFASEGYARKRKHHCQKNLLNSIANDPLYNELAGSEIARKISEESIP